MFAATAGIPMDVPQPHDSSMNGTTTAGNGDAMLDVGLNLTSFKVSQHNVERRKTGNIPDCE